MDFTITDRKSIQVKRKSLIQERQKMEEQKMELEALRKDKKSIGLSVQLILLL